MASTAEIAVLINAKDNLSAAIKQMEENVGKSATKIKGHTDNLTKYFHSLGEAVLGALAVESIIHFAEESIKAFDNVSVTMAKLQNSVGDAAGELENFAKAQMSTTRYSKEELLASEALLASFGRSKDQIKQLLPAIEDYATATGVDLQTATTLFNRAINNSSDSLGRYHLGIKGVAGTQERINDIVKKSTEYWGGQAAAVAGVGAGPFIQLQNQLKEVSEIVGKELMPDLNDFADWLKGGGVEAVGEFAKATLDLINLELKPLLMISEMLGGKKLEIFQTEELIKEAKEAKNVNTLFTERSSILQQIDTLQAELTRKSDRSEGYTFKELKSEFERLQMLKTQSAMLKSAISGMIEKPKTGRKPPPESDLENGKKLEAQRQAHERAMVEIAKMEEEGKVAAMDDGYAKQIAEVEKKEKEKLAKIKEFWMKGEINTKQFMEANKTIEENAEKEKNQEKRKFDEQYAKDSEEIAAMIEDEKIDAMHKGYEKQIAEIDKKELKKLEKLKAWHFKGQIDDKTYEAAIKSIGIEADKDRLEAKKQAMLAMGKEELEGAGMVISALQSVAEASGANARTQAAIAGSMAVVQGAQAVMQVLAAPMVIPEPAASVWKGIEISAVIATTLAQIAKISSAKFAFGGVVAGNPASGDSVHAMLTPGERVLTVKQQESLSASNTFHIDNSTVIQGGMDPRAVSDFKRAKQQQARDLISALRYAKLTRQNLGTFA